MKVLHKILLVLLPVLLACEKPDTGIDVPPPSDKTAVDEPDDPDDPEQPGTEATDFIIVGYATYWDSTMPDPSLLTHINYAFAHIKSDFESLDVKNETRLAKIAALKDKNPKLKVLLSVGGWEAGNFSEMAADDTHRKNFCNNCLTVVKKHNLDGIDIDWEYPTSNAAGISASPNDTKNFTKLMKDLRETLGQDKLVTMASYAKAKYIDFKNAIEYMDFVNIMSYDMGKPPYHNAALYKSSMTKYSCDEAVAAHYSAGVPYRKIVLGVPFYGHGDGSTFSSDCVDYNEIKTTGYQVKWDQNAQVPYLTNSSGVMVLSYDDETSVGLKADYVKSKGLLGAMYWNIEADDSKWSLSKALSTRLLTATSPQDNPNAILVTNQYVQKFLEEVDYGNSDYTYSKVIGYPGGGPSENNIEIPPTVNLEWNADASAGDLTLTLQESDWSRTYSIKAGTNSYGVTNLVPGTRYTWQVTSTSGSVIANGSFDTKGLLHQVYFTPNVRNGRDLGGYKGLNGKTIAYHKIYRGGRVDGKYLDDAGRADMRAEGIKAEVDLREASDVPKTSPLGSDIDFYAPGFDSGYNHMVRDNPTKVKDTFMWVVQRLRENKPVYFHCAAGRDRTATLAVLIEGALGMSESDMAKDYELTYFSPADWGMSTENGQSVYKHTRDNYSYGSIRKTIYSEITSGTYQERITKYLLKIGVPQKDIDDLRSIMLR